MGFTDWVQRRSDGALEKWCVRRYRQRVTSAPAQQLFESSRRNGWEDERILATFHRTNWPTVAKEAAERMGRRSHAHNVFRKLTATDSGAAIATRAMFEAFRSEGYSRETITSAIERSNAGEFG